MSNQNEYLDNDHELYRAQDIRVIVKTLRGDNTSWSSLDVQLKSEAQCTLCGQRVKHGADAQILIIGDYSYILHPTCVQLVRDGDFDSLSQKSAVFRRVYRPGVQEEPEAN